MKTFDRICTKDFSITDEHNQTLNLKRGKEYLTSEEENNKVMVFTRFWVEVPADIFAGEIQFT